MFQNSYDKYNQRHVFIAFALVGSKPVVFLSVLSVIFAQTPTKPLSYSQCLTLVKDLSLCS